MPRFPAYPNEGRTIREYPLGDYGEFIEGAFVMISNGEVDECGANPSEILGVALHDSGALPLENDILVAVAKSKATFILQGDEVPKETDEGVEYGITKDDDGVWHVDKTKTGGDARVVVERVFIGNLRDQYEVSVLPAYRQLD